MTVEQCWQATPGGSGTYIARLSEALAAVPGVELCGIAARHDGPPDDDFRPTLRHLASSRLPRPLLYEAWNRVGHPRAEGIARRPLDVVHATTWAVPTTARPLVVTVHDLAFLTDPGMFTPRGVRFFERALTRVRAEADLVIVPSPATRDACVAHGIPERSLRLVPHGVEMPPVAPAEMEAFRREHGLTRPYVMWCGTLEPRKNVTGVIDGFTRARAQLTGHDLVLVGPSGWGDQHEARRGTDAAVHWLGKLSRADLARAYAGADAFCYPSFAEGFGLPVLEAMTYGVPVVTSTGTPMVDLVGDAGVAVDPTDTAAIGAALAAVVGDRAALTAPARARARLFSWDAAARATLGVYRELL
jgi:glycosyltransferase involved in cell wall biosynthesis